MTTPAPDVDVTTLPDDAVLLDVREDDEWAAGHAPGAVHLPLSGLVSRLHEVPDPPEGSDALTVVCRSGGRSAQAAAYLAQYGHAVRNAAGGMQAWAAAGKPLAADGDQAAAPRVL